MSSTISRRLRRRVAVPAAVLALAVAGAGSLVVATAGSAQAGSATSQYGTLSSADTVLPPANKCGSFTFSYDLAPPPGNWAVEFFVVDPRGNTVASWAALNQYSAGGPKGSTPFTLCSNNTRAGVFTLSAKMSTDDGSGNISNYQMTPATFTLSAPVTTSTPTSTSTTSKKAKKRAAAKKALAKKRALAKKKAQQRKKRQQRNAG